MLDGSARLPISDRPVNMASPFPRLSASALSFGLLSLLALPAAWAQPAPAAPPAPAPAAPPAPAPAPAPVQDRIAEALAPQPGGLTPDEAARLAVGSKHSIRAKQAELRAAAAKVDQALVNYFPRVSVTAGYTRLSKVVNQLGGGTSGTYSVGSKGGGLLGACTDPSTPVPPGTICAINPTGPDQPVAAVPVQGFSFPVILDSYSFVATVSVPISDYVLRISQGYAAASHAESGKRLEVEAEALSAAADAKIAYFNWIGARGGYVVAQEALAQAETHLKDTRRSFDVGIASKADVLRFESQVASAKQGVIQAEAFANLAEEQLRIGLGLPADKPLAIGTDVLHAPVDVPTTTLAALQEQALSRRLDIRALDETEYSLKENVKMARAGYLPRIDAFADAYYQNPNQRVFPQTNQFRGTWDAGVRLSWTINDTFSALGQTSEAKARVEQVAEQKAQLRDGLRLEVASAYGDLVKAAASIEAADQGLVAAEEALRVRQELYRAGKGTTTELLDAEVEVTRARLSRLSARVSLAVAKVRLDHATGKDVPAK
jgi:outer membrane protein TolC